jgi:hypothetical protein
LRSLRQRCELRRFLIVFPSIGLMLNEKPHYAQKRDKPLWVVTNRFRKNKVENPNGVKTASGSIEPLTLDRRK